MRDYKIAPSILSADFARLGEEVTNVLASGADIVHFDVMDNHYVPNLTIGPLVCEALRKHGVKADIDVHLMVKPVDRIIPDFAKAGATYITFHPEGTEHIDRSLQLVRDSGCKSGLVFNPATPLDHLKYVMDKVDMILLMSVNPGFGGQSFLRSSLDKLREARKMIDASGRPIRLEIDGGVKVDNIREIAEAGADTFVAGSAIFRRCATSWPRPRCDADDGPQDGEFPAGREDGHDRPRRHPDRHGAGPGRGGEPHAR
jgi:ribulose-phosphate 3-epimerase